MVLRGQGRRRGTIEVSPAGDVLLCSGEVDLVVVAEFVDRRRRAGSWHLGLGTIDMVDVRATTFVDSSTGELVRSVASARRADQDRLTVRGASPVFVQVLDVVDAAHLVVLTD